MDKQLVFDFSSAGFTRSAKGFFLHSAIVAAVSGLGDLLSSINNYHVSDRTVVTAAGLALLSSAIHSVITWLNTRKDQVTVDTTDSLPVIVPVETVAVPQDLPDGELA